MLREIGIEWCVQQKNWVIWRSGIALLYHVVNLRYNGGSEADILNFTEAATRQQKDR
jgi:hypothetical protein